ncbi:MFS transporter [Mycobacterium simiae]|uniref:MFS transporter n=1 Tax=Mycobacterium simiae TaxID=1784 RepID=UPI00165F85E9|nr:MFS transporter [Mycobacterium simiae]
MSRHTPVAAPHQPDESGVLWRVAWRLLPLLLLLYVVSFLDRVNIATAALQMNTDLGLDATTYGWASGSFFLTYLLCQVPANWAFYRLGMRRWMAIILTTWGLCSAATAFVSGPVSLTAARLVLGAAEAGFYPAVICYLGRWFPSRFRARAVAVFLLAIPVANIVGTPLSSALVEHAGLAGLPGWRTMFLLEGLPAVALAAVAWRVLPDSVSQARWLSGSERRWLSRQIETESHSTSTGLMPGLTNRLIALLALVNVGLYFSLYAVQFFLPQIIARLSPKASITDVGWIAAGCYVIAAFAMFGWSLHSDRSGERIVHIIAPAFSGAIVLAGTVLEGSNQMLLIGITLMTACVFAAIPVFWSLTTAFWSGAAAATGVATVNAISSLASFLGPYLTGFLTDSTGDYRLALLVTAGFLILTVVGTVAVNNTAKRAIVRSLR